MKKLSVKTVVAIGIGAALFFVLGKIAIPSPVPNTNISLQYAIQTVFATLFGPGCVCEDGCQERFPEQRELSWKYKPNP